MAERKDEFLTNQLQTGSVDAYKTLFNLYYKPLCSFAKKYVLDLAVAEDIVQELFVRFWEQWKEVQLETSVRSYFFQSVRNECLNYLKHQGVNEKYKMHIENASTDIFFYDKLEEEEINQLVYQTIQTLPPRCKQIFELSRFEGKTFEEISLELSISKNTIKNQLVRALKHIRQVLEKNEILLLITYFLGFYDFI
jgi:RNA polymerase sigma-70 factor (ECF subfamily)